MEGLGLGGTYISIVLDNALYHHCHVDKEKIAELGINLTLPLTYSLNLNDIESL